MPVAPSGSLGTEQEEFGWATPAGGGGGVNVVVLRWQVFPVCHNMFFSFPAA